MASYAAVETALARMHCADAEAQRGAFRGRIKHFQRLGLPLDTKPGKGKRIEYDERQIWQLAFALELAEFGIDPKTTVELIKFAWELILEPWLIEEPSEHSHSRAVLLISVALMSGSWRPVGDTMQGLVSLTWHDRHNIIESMLTAKRRRLIVVDTWRMLKELRRHLEDLTKE